LNDASFPMFYLRLLQYCFPVIIVISTFGSPMLIGCLICFGWRSYVGSTYFFDVSFPRIESCGCRLRESVTGVMNQLVDVGVFDL
jgi:hypothetical protein